MAQHSAVSPHAAIAVFDSGLGGLTVVRALRAVLPNEDFIYYGDTARVPYGTKSPETVARFTSEICEFLLHFEPKCIIAACHTARQSIHFAPGPRIEYLGQRPGNPQAVMYVLVCFIP